MSDLGLRSSALLLLAIPALAACGGGGGSGGAASSSSSTAASTTGAGGEGGSISTSTTSTAAGMGGAGGTGGTGGMGGAGGAPMTCDIDGEPGVCIDVGDCKIPSFATPGYCPGAANIQCCTKIPAGTCDPHAMVEPNQGLVEEPGLGGCPPGMAKVTTFCVDRWEASLVMMNGGAPVSPYFNPGMQDVRAVSIKGAVPQGYISQIEAETACMASGKRLCADTEWLRACQGPKGTTYPYGDQDEPGVCNDARAVHPAIEYYGTSDPWIFSHLDNACLNQLKSSLDPAGSLPGCVTAEGLFDMMGNLHEWTADPAGTFRGGYYVDTKLNGPGCLYATTAHTVTYWDYSTGFRCCADLP
jgi:formylglycine-generating enzyme